VLLRLFANHLRVPSGSEWLTDPGCSSKEHA